MDQIRCVFLKRAEKDWDLDVKAHRTEDDKHAITPNVGICSGRNGKREMKLAKEGADVDGRQMAAESFNS